MVVMKIFLEVRLETRFKFSLRRGCNLIIIVGSLKLPSETIRTDFTSP